MILLEKNKKNLITDSATQGLYLLFNAIQSSNSVILHPNTCLHVYMAAIYARKKIYFVDIESDTCNYKKHDLEKTIKFLKEKEKTPPIVLIVHLYGITCPLEIINICKKNNLIIIEDCAQALFSFYSDNSYVGSKGSYSVFSFGATKHLELGSSGLIIFNNQYKYHEIKSSLSKLRSNKSNKNNQNKQYIIDYYSLLDDKLSHKVIVKRKKAFEKFLLHYSKIFSEGLIENEYKITEIKTFLKENMKSKEDMVSKENLILERLKNCPIKLFKKKSEFIFWRFSFLIAPEDRKILIPSIRKKYPYLSTWYPSIPNMIEYKSIYKFNGSRQLGSTVCNIDNRNLTHNKLNKILDLIEAFYN